MDWHELEKMKVTALREMAKEQLKVEGAVGMAKADLVEALAKHLGIEKPHKVAEGKGKSELKKKIRALKAKRTEAFEAHDHESLAATRHEIHRLKRRLRKMARLHG
jgi:prolyl-tRNA synthetase